MAFLLKVSPGKVNAAYARGHTGEDIDQAAFLAAATAARKFDPHRGAAFASYATWYFRSALDVLTRPAQSRTPPGGFVASLDGWSDDGEGFDLADHRGDHDGPPMTPLGHWCSDEYRRQRDCLHWRGRVVLYLRCVEGWPQAEIGRVLGLTRQRVQQIERSATNRLARRRDQLNGRTA